MPGEVGEVPEIAPLLTDLYRGGGESKIQESTDLRTISASKDKIVPQDVLARLQHGVNEAVADIKNQFLNDIDPNDEDEYYKVENEVETVCNIVFGPLRLERSTLRKEGKISESEKEYSARIQHAITALAYYGGLPDADPALAENAYRSIKLGKRLAAIPTQQRLDTELPILWRGIQNETAVVKALKRGGYDVFLPDYNQDTSALESDEDNEVLQLDVKSGIDMIAVRNGRVFLIDAKGKLNPSGDSSIDRRAVTPPQKVRVGAYNSGVKRALESIQEKVPVDLMDMYKTIIMIPSAATNFQCYELPDNPKDVRTQLSQFGRLDQLIERTTLMRLENVDNSKPYWSYGHDNQIRLTG